MESEVVRRVREGYEAFNRGDEGYFRIKARGSGMTIEDRAFHVWTIQDGKATRLEFYADRAEARAAAGLDQRG